MKGGCERGVAESAELRGGGEEKRDGEMREMREMREEKRALQVAQHEAVNGTAEMGEYCAIRAHVKGAANTVLARHDLARSKPQK